jgi:putative hydrolase of the HAD superfamily
MSEPAANGLRAIVSDFGGVLTTPLLGSFERVQDEIEIPAESLGKALRAATEERGDNPLFELERGELEEVEFLELLAAQLEPLLGHRPHLHRFREVYFDALDPNEPMIALMRELKASGLKMAMLTNNVREWEPLWRSMLPVDEIFELVVDSGFVGVRKPDPAIYELTLQRLGVPAEATLFVDDMEINCDAARALGMQAVWFRSTAQAIADVEALLAPAS